MNAIQNEISDSDYFFMNAAVSDFKMSLSNSEKIPKSKIEEYLKKNLEIVPDILKKISKSKKYNQVLIGNNKTNPIAVKTINRLGNPCIPTDKKNPTNINSLKLNNDLAKTLDLV